MEPKTGGTMPYGKDLIDLAAIGAVFGSWASLLPEIAAGFAIIWTLVRIYEWARVRIFKKQKDLDL